MARFPLLVALLVLLAGFYSCYNSFDPNRISSLTMPALLWSDPATWTGTANISPSTGVPQAGDAVTIPSGVTVCVDVDTADLGMVNISGTLTADDTVDVELTADGIMVMNGGLLEIGTEAQPFEHKFTFTINGADPGFYLPDGTLPVGSPITSPTQITPRLDNGLTGLASMPAARGIMVMNGGSMSLIGAVPTRTKTKIDEHAPAGTRRLTLADHVDWKQGDQIAISITDYYGYGETEVLTLERDTFGGRGVKLTSALQDSRWGRLQYVTSSGLALKDDRTVSGVQDETPTFLDQRAEVVNLTRNIVIQAPDDSLWANGGDGAADDSGSGFGVHTMIMRGAVVARANGVEFRRCGQGQRIARYAWHWHIMNYSTTTRDPSTGQVFVDGNGDPINPAAYIGPDLDASNHYVKNCTFYDSANRAVNIHATCGVDVIENYAVKIRGHAFFMEDGSEERNVITDCVAMDIRNPAGKQLITNSESDNRTAYRDRFKCIKKHDSEAAGFWVTNPLNRVERNWGSECAGMAVWNAFAEQVFGDTANARNSSGNEIFPNRLLYTAFNDNVGHSCAKQGLRTANPAEDESGGTTSVYYLHDLAADCVTAQEVPVEFIRNSHWKNNIAGYSNRVRNPRYIHWVVADNHGVDFTGATRTGAEAYGPSQLWGPLMIGESLNNEHDFPAPQIAPFFTYRRTRRGAASYHFFLNTYDAIVVNYPLEVNSVFTNPKPMDRNEQKAGGGFMSMGDMYLHKFESFFYMPGWMLINSSAGYVSPPSYFDGYPIYGPFTAEGLGNAASDFIHHPLTSAVEDWWGYWGPEKWYVIPNEPFFTHDMDSSAVPVDNSGPAGANLKGWDGHTAASVDDGKREPIQVTPSQPYAYSTPDRMFGIGGIWGRPNESENNGLYETGTSSGSDKDVAHQYERLNATTLAVVDEFILGDASPRASSFDFSQDTYWTNKYGGNGNPSGSSFNSIDTTFGFRHFGAMNHGYYKISFPGGPTVRNTNLVQPAVTPATNQIFTLITENLKKSDDWIVLCVPWSASTAYGRYQVGGIESGASAGGYRDMNTGATSVSQVVNDATATTMYLDTVNQVLWLKLMGGLSAPTGWLTDAEIAGLTANDAKGLGSFGAKIDADQRNRATRLAIRPDPQSSW